VIRDLLTNPAGYEEDSSKLVQPWIDMGAMVPVKPREMDDIAVWCELPWHVVESAGKLRVVINGLAKEGGGISTTELLDPGPNLLPKITKIMTKLRQLPHFLIVDIEKAFLQIGLQYPDSHLLLSAG